MNNLSNNIVNNIGLFLQRTDQIALKLTSKYYLNDLKILMDLDTELKLYTKTIDQMDYAWKTDSRYINIKTLSNSLVKYSILEKYAVITDLWYFDFNAEFDIKLGEHIIMFMTNVSEYQINLEFTDKIGNITKSTHNPVQNKIKVNFEIGGKLKVNCKEITKYKNLKTVQYIMCIPIYYWNKLANYQDKLYDWKKQIIMTNGDYAMIKNFT